MDASSSEYMRMTQELNYLRDEVARLQLQLRGTRSEIGQWRRIFVTGCIEDGTTAHRLLKILLDEVRAWRGHFDADDSTALDMAMQATDATGILNEPPASGTAAV